MPTHNATLRLSFNQRDSLECCRLAVAELGWLVQDRSLCHLRCREANWISFHWPVGILVIAEPESDTWTRVRLYGSNVGWGPIANRTVRREVARFSAQVQLIARGTAVYRRTHTRRIRVRPRMLPR